MQKNNFSQKCVKTAHAVSAKINKEGAKICKHLDNGKIWVGFFSSFF